MEEEEEEEEDEEEDNEVDTEESSVNGSKLSADAVANSADDDEGWITPSNIKKIKDAKKAEKPLPLAKVACITTDFAMQNVLLQMRLRVISFEGMAIRSAKTWVLRCHACFKYGIPPHYFR